MSSKYLQAIVASFALFSSAAIAAGETPPITVTAEAPSKRVSYADLNLASTQGVSILKRRVRSAAEDLCTSGGLAPLWQRRVERECMRTAIDGAAGPVELAVAGFERRQYARAKYIEIAARR